jgi:Tfp pilus assembly protein PilO
LITDRSEIQARKFYAQRNLYLTGFTLFQTLIVTRTYNLVYELLNLKDEVRSNGAHSTSNEEVTKLKAELTEKTENLEILKKQAESLRRDYDQLSEEQLSGKDTVEPISDKKSD